MSWPENAVEVLFNRQTFSLIRNLNPITAMAILKQCFIALLIGISICWSSSLVTADQITTITEDECARLQHSEIIWHLSEYRWLCCIPKSENEYESCIPVLDMEPLPKTSPKPFPPNTTKTIKP